MIKSSFFTILLVFAGLAGGIVLAGKASNPDQELASKLAWLNTTSGKTAQFTKSVFQGLQGRTENSEGEISVRKGSIKIAVKPPNETLLVVNSKAIWLETPMGEGFPTSVQKMKRQSAKAQSGIWEFLTGQKKVRNFFSVKKTSKKGVDDFELSPKKAGNVDLTSLTFSIKGNELQKLTYTDELENVVTYNFKKWNDKKLSAKIFDYTPPKNAEVSEL